MNRYLSHKVRVRKRDFSKHFTNVEDNTLIIIQLNRGSIADLSLLRTLLAICQVVRAKFLGVILFFFSFGPNKRNNFYGLWQ